MGIPGIARDIILSTSGGVTKCDLVHVQEFGFSTIFGIFHISLVEGVWLYGT